MIEGWFSWIGKHFGEPCVVRASLQTHRAPATEQGEEVEENRITSAKIAKIPSECSQYHPIYCVNMLRLLWRKRGSKWKDECVKSVVECYRKKKEAKRVTKMQKKIAFKSHFGKRKNDIWWEKYFISLPKSLQQSTSKVTEPFKTLFYFGHIMRNNKDAIEGSADKAYFG